MASVLTTRRAALMVVWKDSASQFKRRTTAITNFYRLISYLAFQPHAQTFRSIISRFAAKLACAILMTMALQPALNAKLKTDENYALEQRSKLIGNFSVQWNSKKLIATSRNGNLSIFADLPSGKLRIYNKETHLYYLSNLSQFKGSYAKNITLLNGFNFDGGNWYTVGSEWMADIPCIRFRPYLESFDETTAMRQQGVRMVDYWVGSSEYCPFDFAVFLAKLFGLPFPGGFPMKVALRTQNLSNLTIFNSEKTMHSKVVVEPKLSDFTKASSENQVMLKAFDPNDVRPFGSKH